MSTSDPPAVPPIHASEVPGDVTGRPGSDVGHTHRSTRADERVWLERIHDEAATMGLHGFCLDCGAVRSMLPKRGRPLGFFHKALGNLQATLDGHPKYAKLAQVHARLIGKALDGVPDFGDPYSMAYETQWIVFLGAVQRVRPDLPIDLIEEALPREPHRRQRPFIDVLEGNRR